MHLFDVSCTRNQIATTQKRVVQDASGGSNPQPVTCYMLSCLKVELWKDHDMAGLTGTLFFSHRNLSISKNYVPFLPPPKTWVVFISPTLEVATSSKIVFLRKLQSNSVARAFSETATFLSFFFRNSRGCFDCRVFQHSYGENCIYSILMCRYIYSYYISMFTFS